MKMKWKCGVLVLFMAGVMCFLQPNTVHASDVSGGSWVLDQGMYWYRCADGTYPSNEICTIDGIRYGFDASGWMAVGWYYQNGNWYYFDNSGAMHYGWVWDGAWYYLEDEQSENPGCMLADCSKNIGNNTYYFWPSGSMRTGWIYNQNNWYYADTNGYLASGWIWDGGAWYYLNPGKCTMAANTWIGNYYVGADGAMRTGWIYYQNHWYYTDASGYMVTGWVQDKNAWYYMQPGTGIMAVNTWVEGCYIGADGVWIPLNAGEQVYYVDKGNGNTAEIIGSYNTAMSSEIFRLLNEYRVSQGLPALEKANEGLQNGVNIRAYEIADTFDHQRPNGEICFTVYDNSCAENIASGYQTAEAVMDAWKNSPGHNSNMLSSYATSVGVAVFVDRNGTPYFVQLFSWD